MKLADSWFHTTKILLSRYHFVSNGSALLRLDWGRPWNVQFAKFDDDEIKFLRDSQALIVKKGRSRGTALRAFEASSRLSTNYTDLVLIAFFSGAYIEEVKSKHKYEHDFYWTHQLFSEK